MLPQVLNLNPSRTGLSQPSALSFAGLLEAAGSPAAPERGLPPHHGAAALPAGVGVWGHGGGHCQSHLVCAAQGGFQGSPLRPLWRGWSAAWSEPPVIKVNKVLPLRRPRAGHLACLPVEQVLHHCQCFAGRTPLLTLQLLLAGQFLRHSLWHTHTSSSHLPYFMQDSGPSVRCLTASCQRTGCQ